MGKLREILRRIEGCSLECEKCKYNNVVDCPVQYAEEEIKESLPPKRITYPGKRNRDTNKYNEARKHIIKALFDEEKRGEG